MEVLKCSEQTASSDPGRRGRGEGGGLKVSGDAGSGQLDYLGYRGAIYLCGLTCLCRLGEPKTDIAEVDLFILQAEQTNRTRLGLVGSGSWSGSGSARRAVGGGGDASSWMTFQTAP